MFVFAAHEYRFRGFRSLGRLTVSGHPGFAGTAPAFQQLHSRRVPTVVWNFAPGRWAMVQPAVRDGADRPGQLRAIARATEPASHVTSDVPFRLGYLPGGRPFAPLTGPVLRHGGLRVQISPSRAGTTPSPADRATVALVRRHVVWQASTLGKLVP